MRNGVLQSGGNLVHGDVQHILVVDVEDLGNQAGADGVGLAGIPVNDHSHSRLRPNVVL